MNGQNLLTDTGAYSLATSPYGTFDQGGNVWEWNEAIVSSSFRGLRGGSWDGDFGDMRADARSSALAVFELSDSVAELAGPRSHAARTARSVPLEMSAKRVRRERGS